MLRERKHYPDLRLHVCRISRIRQCLHLCASQAVLRHHSYRIIKLFYFTSDVHKLGDCRIQMFRPPKLKKEKTDTEPLWKFRIDTGTDEQQLIAANPISREVLLEITGFTSD